MNLFREQNVYYMIVVFLHYYFGRGLSFKPKTLFPTPTHGITTRHPFLNIELATAHELKQMEELSNVAHFGDAEHRGPAWYDYKTTSEDSDSDERSRPSSGTTSSSSSVQETSGSSEASSFETRERRIATRVYRTCTPCPHDMLKKYKNRGIKWICGGYQRARRTFKSECMMRYRNCQDGTLFVKVHEHRCADDPYHGRHFLYNYRA